MYIMKNNLSQSEERGKTSWEKPSLKKRDEKTTCMDGWSNQDPPLQHTLGIYKGELGKGKSSPDKREEEEGRGQDSPPPLPNVE